MDKSLGARIKEYRNQKGLTSDKLAVRCNIDTTYLRQIEGGIKTPSLNLFINICNKLEVSPNYLLQDIVKANELSEFPELEELWEKCSPKQTAMFVAILKEAIKHTQ